jgi:hypothetical protein
VPEPSESRYLCQVTEINQSTWDHSNGIPHSLVNVEQELFVSSVKVGNGDYGIVGTIDPSRSVGPLLAERTNNVELTAGRIPRGPGLPRQQDVLRGSSGFTDSFNRGLKGLCKRSHVGDIMRFVHQTEHDFRFRFILDGQLCPDVGELSVGRSTLSDDRTVPTTIVVQVQDGISTFAQDVLNELVVLGEPRSADGTSERTSNGRVPTERKSVHVGTVLAKVSDLGFGRVRGGQRVGVVAWEW